jgi:hypothetical protein
MVRGRRGIFLKKFYEKNFEKTYRKIFQKYFPEFFLKYSGHFRRPEFFSHCKKFFRKFFSRKFCSGPDKKIPAPNPMHLRPETTIQNHLFSKINDLQSGHATASVSRQNPNGARIVPRLGSDTPLFGAKLLVVLSKQGVRHISWP